MLSMVGATLPAAPSVRKQKSIAFSMLFGRTIAYASSPPEGKGEFSLFLFYTSVFFSCFGSDGSGYFGRVVTWGIGGGGGVRAPCFAAYEARDEGKTQEI